MLLNTIPKIQPRDAGTIAAMMVHYHTFQLAREMDLVEEMVIADIGKISVLSDMQAF